MEVKPVQVAVACVAAFVGIVALSMYTSYRSNEDFREKFSNLDFSTLRPRLLREEGITAPSLVEDADEDNDEDD
jgi:hypothetical protein